jgi:hypothetical protein
MRIHVELENLPKDVGEVQVGNVYQVRGGKGSKYGYMTIIIAMYDDDYMCACITIDKEGAIVGASTYAKHYFSEKMPIAFVDGIDGIDLTLRSL